MKNICNTTPFNNDSESVINPCPYPAGTEHKFPGEYGTDSDEYYLALAWEHAMSKDD